MDEAGEQPLVTWTHAMYCLHALSLVAFILGVATITGPLLLGCPSIIAVTLNYMRHRDVRGTWLESHFRWQTRTFWYGLLWALPWITAGSSASSVISRVFCPLSEEFCTLFLAAAVAIAMAIILLPLGILPCPKHRQGEISAAHLSDTLTCAAVRVVSLWLIYRLARG